MAADNSPYLPLDQAAGDRTRRMPLRHNRTEPLNAAGARGQWLWPCIWSHAPVDQRFIHNHDTLGATAC